MTNELVEKYAKEIMENSTYANDFGGEYPTISDYRATDILTRLLAEYDAQKGVEGKPVAWLVSCGEHGKLFFDEKEAMEHWDNSWPHREHKYKHTPLYSQYAPKGVDVERVWGELYVISMEKLATNCAGGGILVSKNDLAAALRAAKEQG